MGVPAPVVLHGGTLATDAPDSPHLLAHKIRSRVYIGSATEDPVFTPDMKQRLEEALVQAGVDHKMETYPAGHGWVLRDHPSYDAACAERHWETVLALFDGTLKR